VKLFAVGCFFFGVVALGVLVERRARKVAPAWPDYALTFIGLAGVITGLILLFNRLQ
jgi:hypothetical protein